MNVVFTFLVDWHHHVATELELVQLHLDAGDNVTILTCLGQNTVCTTNVGMSEKRCHQCIKRRVDSLRLASDSIKVESFGSYLKKEDRSEEKNLDSKFCGVEAAQKYMVDDWDIGFAALSTTIHNYRDPAISSPEAQSSWSRLIHKGFLTHRATLNYIEQNPEVDRFYIFNGRFAMARAILRACQKKKVDVFIHERGSNPSKYQIYENHLPHDRDPFFERLRAAWSDADEESREKTGAEFFQGRRSGVEDLWISFTKDQKKGLLPESWDPSVNNIVIFNSSEDEFIGIGKEWQNPIYPSQGEAIERIANDLKDDDSVNLYIRMHPNLTGIDNEDTRRILAIDLPSVEVIPAESPISSYDLIDNANKVLTFGSSVGVEATYWGKPSILAGLCFYRDLDVAYVCESHQDTLDFLFRDLPPKPQINAIKYGFYLRTFGRPFHYYQPVSLYEGTFNGKPVISDRSPALQLVPSLVKLLGRHPTLYRNAAKFIRPVLHTPFTFVDRLLSKRNPDDK